MPSSTLYSLRAVLIVAICLVGLGCGKDEVQTYKVAKSSESSTKPAAQPAGPDKMRLLGAIIPIENGQSYFVKMSGTIENVSPHAEAFEQFVKSIQLTGDPKKPLSYTPPANWKSGPSKMMRQVTFLVGDSPKPLEAYISDPFAGSVIDNVNRWRKEVGAAEVSEAELAKVTKEIDLGKTKAYLVDARGPGGTGGMMPPFMGGQR
jgi:hypothetical protein